MDTEILNLIFWEKYGSKKTYLSEKISKTTQNFSRFFLVTTEEFVRKTRYCSGFVKSKIFPISNFQLLFEKRHCCEKCRYYVCLVSAVFSTCSLYFSFVFLLVLHVLCPSLPLLKSYVFLFCIPSGLACTVLKPYLI